MTVRCFYSPFNGPCRALLMVARELDLDLDLQKVDILAGEHLRPEFLEMNPYHCVPTIEDSGFILWESTAIIQYLFNKFAPNHGLYPKDPQTRGTIDRLLYFDGGSLRKSQRDYLRGLLNDKVEEEAESRYWDKLNALNNMLQDHDFLAGDDISVADLVILATITTMELVNHNFSSFPYLLTWLRKMKQELPYYQEINGKPLRELKAWLQANPSEKTRLSKEYLI